MLGFYAIDLYAPWLNKALALENEMIVRVKAFASFREILGHDLSVNLEDGSTVRNLLDDLVSSRRQLKSAVFDESGGLRDHVVIMKNRKNIESLDGLDTMLREGDCLAILPPVAGG
jgi:molybdopterin synthase sulfur carrier subunit